MSAVDGTAGTRERGSARPLRVLRNPFVLAFLGGVIVLTAMRPYLRRVPELPPVVGQVPAFALVDQDGAPFRDMDLRGRVGVVSFFFTRCRSICPALMGSLRILEERYAEAGEDGIRLVSISVDPGHDTPERLRAYAAEQGVDTARWTLATGATEEVRALVVDGFKVPMGPAEGSGDLMDIAHTGKFVLVDAEGGIRGYYDTNDLGLDEIFHRSLHLARHNPGVRR